jgi:hypothetical protein
MPDLKITDEGDLVVSAWGDLETVETRFHNYAQQAYIRMMTEIGDFVAYPQLGANLVKLVGMPNTPATADYGRTLILDSLSREGVFADVGVEVVPVPTGRYSIRFDIYITAGSRQKLILSIEQDLVALGTEGGLALTDGSGNVIGA